MDLSSCEAEYVVVSYTTYKVAWIEMLLEELKIMEPNKRKMFVDNKSAIYLENHLVCHGQSKHIERRYHLLRDQVNKGKVVLEYCKSEL